MSVDLGAGLFAWAKTVASLTAILGTGDACQWYPEALASAKTPPFVIYSEQRDAEAARHDSPAMSATTQVTFTCVGASRLAAVALSDALYAALMVPRFRGSMGGVAVQAVLYKRSSPSYQWEEYQFAVEAEYTFCYNL